MRQVTGTACAYQMGIAAALIDKLNTKIIIGVGERNLKEFFLPVAPNRRR